MTSLEVQQRPVKLFLCEEWREGKLKITVK